MKKIIITLVLLLIVGFGTWSILLRNSPSDEQLEDNFEEFAKDLEAQEQPIENIPAPVSKGETNSAVIDQVTQEDSEIPDRSVQDKDMDKFQVYFQEVEQRWQEKMEELIVKELGKGEQAFRTYLGMREGFENDKMEAFEEHHKQLEQKHGKNYTYRPSEDEQNFAKKLLPVYQEKLKSMLGDDGYKKYEGVKSDFNSNESQNADAEIGFMQMEF